MSKSVFIMGGDRLYCTLLMSPKSKNNNMIQKVNNIEKNILRFGVSFIVLHIIPDKILFRMLSDQFKENK